MEKKSKIRPAYMPSRYQKARVWVLAILGFVLLKAISCTLRWRPPRSIPPEALKPGPKIFIFWHGRQLFMSEVHSRVFVSKGERPAHTLSSGHSDGRIMAKITRWCGYPTVQGSTSRGSVRALRELERLLLAGESIGMTPDGPKGPNREIHNLGALHLAKMTGAPLIPLAYSAKRSWQVSSWDKFMVPKFFSEISYLVDEPIVVPSGATPNELRIIADELQRRVNELTDQVDRSMGRLA